MPTTSRRSFLAAAGAGTAVTTVAGSAANAGPATTPATGPLVAHIRDASTGTLMVYAGDHEVVVHDRDLVRRLTRAAGL